jgi:type IV secretory pathway TrbL component
MHVFKSMRMGMCTIVPLLQSIMYLFHVSSYKYIDHSYHCADCFYIYTNIIQYVLSIFNICITFFNTYIIQILINVNFHIITHLYVVHICVCLIHYYIFLIHFLSV